MAERVVAGHTVTAPPHSPTQHSRVHPRGDGNLGWLTDRLGSYQLGCRPECVLQIGCLGALDETHIRIRVPREDQPRYRNRKGEITTNVLGVCTRDELFVYVMAGWEGSAADSRVLQSAILKLNGLKVPEGQYYLVDAGFTNGPGFLAPYRGQRYHLSEWREGRNPTNPKECFNMRHSSARNVIERCFGMLKKRWAILRNPSFYPVRMHNRIILCCCLLHNLIREHSVLDPLENQVYEDTQPVDCETV
ncbi:protein ALP1-like [Senna tora]|uniref:Protein ALP1-like n=1 Tax=Senna tora TaxID=362788 RepID=A0A834SEL3_9FABA|nr:protein ALP1-like [Senna tora]